MRTEAIFREDGSLTSNCARKIPVFSLHEGYKCENDLVDLFYAITHCQGWIRASAVEVKVRLEPHQQPRRRAPLRVSLP
jgi:hypothetical protein